VPITTLDGKAALIAIDLQKGIVGMQTVIPTSDVVARSAELAKAFRRRGLTVVLVNVTAATPGRTDEGPRKFAFSDDWAELVPELEQQPGDHLVSKQCVGAFYGTDLHEYLRGHGVTQVFVTGIATSGGVESTAREARDRGYNVVIVVDAVTDRDAETQRHCVEKLFPRISETGTTEDVLALLGA
jgi:nicotinamidase-related amidase